MDNQDLEANFDEKSWWDTDTLIGEPYSDDEFTTYEAPSRVAAAATPTSTRPVSPDPKDKPKPSLPSFIIAISIFVWLPMAMFGYLLDLLLSINNKTPPSFASSSASRWYFVSGGLFFCWLLQVPAMIVAAYSFGIDRAAEDMFRREVWSGSGRVFVRQMYLYVCAVVLLVLGASLQLRYQLL
ncbi:MAG: hypothetical protein GOMPHAMPRED_005128 [Gomphillus americanus]|uniref:Transmembrane protein n=1 Tax=Gomphillus americanus TaxID=1940652 RepID=A0A8H3I4Z1_9LECA|nr:MAG: hypothetical protein GOMPHAMPRED_005128 [Gomphillus americanus]